MTQILNNISYLFNSQIERHRNKPFLKATMASCALVAVSSGKITLFQRMKIDQILESQIRLSMFEPHQGVYLFNEYTQDLLRDSETTRKQLYDLIKAVIDCQETANSLVQMSVTMLQNQNQTSEAILEINFLCELLGVQQIEHLAG